MKNNLIQERSFQFAVRIVKLSRFLVSESAEYTLSRQLLRSGTSIGANVEEALHAQTRKDFAHKLYIARKEASETMYWLRLLVAAELVEESKISPLLNEATEIFKILSSIILTTEKNQASKP